MGNIRGVTFKANDTEYTMRLTTNAMVRFEEMTGKTLLSALSEMGDDANISVIRSIFCVGLGSDMEPHQAGELMDEIGLTAAMKYVSAAANMAFGDKDAPAGKSKGKKPQKVN